MQIKAYAKINWYLDITGKRPDGYHELDMINQQVDLHDDLFLTASDTLSLSVEGHVPGVPSSGDNLVLRAAQALRQAGGVQAGAALRLYKRIPIGAGLGGGSADAAAALMGLNRLWSLGYSLPALQTIGLRLGADIPYCLAGGLARVTGIGEIIQPLPAPSTCRRLLIIKPPGVLRTKDVFAQYRPEDRGEPTSPDKAYEALVAGDDAALRRHAKNSLQPAAIRLVSGIQDAIRLLYENGASLARMTGAGSAVYGIFNSESCLSAACERLAPLYSCCIETRTLTTRANYAIVAHKAAQDFCRWQGA